MACRDLSDDRHDGRVEFHRRRPWSRIAAIILALCVAALPAPVSALDEVTPQSIEKRLSRIRLMADAGEQLAAARDLLTRVRGNGNATTEVLVYLTMLHLDRGEALDARDTVREALAMPGVPAGSRFRLLTLLAQAGMAAADSDQVQAALAEEQALLTRMRRTPSWRLQHRLWVTYTERSRMMLHALRGDFAAAEQSGRTALSVVEGNVRSPGPRGPAEQMRPNSAEYAALLEATARDLALLLARAGKLTLAETTARRALESTRKHTGERSPETARALATLSACLAAQGRNREAEKSARDGLAVARAAGLPVSSRIVLDLRAQLGDALAMQRRWREAAAAFDERATAFRTEDTSTKGTGVGHPARALALIRTGRNSEALKLLGRMRERTENMGGANTFAQALNVGLIGLAHTTAGRHAEAVGHYRASLPVLIGRAFIDLLEEREAPAHTARLGYVLEGYVRSLVRLKVAGKPDTTAVEEAFAIADFSRVSGLQTRLSTGATRAAARNPALAKLVAEELVLARRAHALRDVLRGLRAAFDPERNRPQIARSTNELEGIERKRAALRETMRGDHAEFANLVEPQLVPMDRIRAALSHDEALISIYSTESETYLWAVRRSGAPAFAIARVGAADLSKAVSKLRDGLDIGTTSLSEIPKFDVAQASRLYNRLLKPLERRLSGAKHLIIVTHRALGALPFALLPVKMATGQDAGLQFAQYRGVPWLLRKASISRLPTASMLPALRDRPPPEQGRLPFVGYGDPVYGSSIRPEDVRGRRKPDFSLRRLKLAVEAGKPVPAARGLAALAPLPETALEVREVGRILGADDTRDIFLGMRASERNVRAAMLRKRAVVMFATHALSAGELAGLEQPALALSDPALSDGAGDGFFTVGEILELPLDADWVVLPGSQTGADGAGIDSRLGIVRAFFAAGARALLLSNWPVEILSVRALQADIFRRQLAHPSMRRDDIVRRAMLHMIDHGAAKDSKGKPRFSYAHPVFWASLMLVGDGSPAALAQ